MSSQLESEAAYEAGVRAFFYRQWFLHRKPVPPGTDLTGHTAIITGANVGLGLEAGRQLLGLGIARLIMAARSPQKGNDAANELKRKFPKAQIEVWTLDMEDYQSIAAFAKRCETLDRIDIVLLNAGINNIAYQQTPSTGHEQTLQVNYISTALLSILLLPVLKAKRPSPSKPAVLCLVTSDTAHWGKIATAGPIMAQFEDKKAFSPSTYSNSKLALSFFVVKLAEQVSSDDVIINMVNPGLTGGTALTRQAPTILRPLVYLFFTTMSRSIEVGTSTYVDAVLRREESHGSYVSDWALRP
jgi:NAD(P)-dependent dehydrogenase (short-subunit alcohol dehydrogenase family)